MGGHDIGDDHDQKLGAVLLQGVAAEQPAEQRNPSQGRYAGLPGAAVIGDQATHDEGAAVLQRQAGADAAAQDGRGAPVRCTGLGLSDGEVLERLWSYLRRLSRMTKEMCPAHRANVLSHALLSIKEKKLGNC